MEVEAGTVDVDQRSIAVLENLKAHPELGKYVDPSLPVPKVFRGTGEIRLVFLGQDPTVANPKSRAKIKMALDLSRKGHLRRYLDEICMGLGLSLEKNVYATNYLKNFFADRPTQIHEVDIFDLSSPYWLPLLQDELAQFPGVPVIELGEPLLQAIVRREACAKLRDYWGYTPDWKLGTTGVFHHMQPADNILERVMFPFPHQPSLRKQFYRDKLPKYIQYMKHKANF